MKSKISKQNIKIKKGGDIFGWNVGQWGAFFGVLGIVVLGMLVPYVAIHALAGEATAIAVAGMIIDL